MTHPSPPPIGELLAAWQNYFNQVVDWQKLVVGTEPKPSGCGRLYELPSPLDRPNEDLAIADMRNIPFAEPHYHPKDNWEFYIALQGTAIVIVGDETVRVTKGQTVVIPPDTAHYTLPDKNFVTAAINIPPFKPENYIKLANRNPDVKFDYEQFKQSTIARK